MWKFPNLKECRRMWDDRFGPREWPEVDDTDLDADAYDDAETDAF